MTTELSGVHALVTGATSGIGRATAIALAERGAAVAVSGRNAERGEQVVREIEAAGGRAVFIANDLHDAESARALATEATARLGQVDVLVNNAGVYPFGPTESMTEKDFDSVFDLNVRAPYFLVSELAPRMAERGKGAIVNLSTIVAEYGNAGTSLYGASKAAVESLTKTWAAEYGPRGVRVNAVRPGPVYTEGTAAMGEGLDELVGPAPAGRPGQPDEIANAIAFLVSDQSSYVHGVTLSVDGGRTAV
ncbi:SDR family NAD(P)-dependent oxidoreductase [Mycobacterium sp. DL99]|uniref:SDR family NAD(P)-dependent oxidoreductase n=1 Tax=Mycobacterium sp. DL99 TaxID=2528957 RepID=UPI0010817DAE|nr:SDR family NAD(P)-dependent oxidoreductase [Mycobacterium sp. DL99]